MTPENHFYYDILSNLEFNTAGKLHVLTVKPVCVPIPLFITSAALLFILTKGDLHSFESMYKNNHVQSTAYLNNSNTTQVYFNQRVTINRQFAIENRNMDD